MARSSVEMDLRFEEEEEDQEVEQLMDILEGVDAAFLQNAVQKRNILVQDMLLQNDISIPEEVILFPSTHGYNTLHLAAAEGLTDFAIYLMKQCSSVDEPDAHGNSPLHWAVFSSDNWLLVDALLLHGAAVNARNAEQRTPLHLACITGHVGCLRSLLFHDAELLAVDDQGATGLLLALLHAHEAVAEILLTQETHVESLVTTLDALGRNPLHALAATPARDPTDTSPERILKLLLQHGAHVNRVDKAGRPPLFSALSSGNHTMFRLLLQAGANVAMCDHRGRSVLHYAAFYNSEDAMNELLIQNPTLDVNGADERGCTPLHAAAGSGASVKRLMLLGGDPFAKDHEGLTPLHYALIDGFEDSFVDMVTGPTGELLPTGEQLSLLDKEGRTLLHYCAAHDFEQLFYRLREAGVSEKKKDRSGHTPLHYAASFGSLNVIRVIFSQLRKHTYATYMNSANSASQKPLHMAAARGDASTCHFFLENRASSWAPDRYGATALHYAARSANLGALEVLLNGKDVKRTDKAGATPLHYAALSGDTNLVELLLDCGADLYARDSQGRTAMFYSADENMMLYFQQCGLDRRQTDKRNRSILFQALQLRRRELFRVLHVSYKMDLMERDKSRVTLLHHAAYCGDVWFIHYLLESTSLTVSTMDGQHRSPVYYAAAAGQNEALELLLEQIEEEDLQEKLVDLRDVKGCSALDAAAFGLHERCAAILLAHMNAKKRYRPAFDGRTPLHVAVNNPLDSPSVFLISSLAQFFDINALDRNGRSCLHRAVFQKLPRTAALLLEKGANPDVQDRKGLTPLMIASYYGAEDLLALLLQYEPDITLTDKKGRTAHDFKLKRLQEADDESTEDEEPDALSTASPGAEARAASTIPEPLPQQRITRRPDPRPPAADTPTPTGDGAVTPGFSQHNGMIIPRRNLFFLSGLLSSFGLLFGYYLLRLRRK